MRIKKGLPELIFVFFISTCPMISSAFGQDAFTLEVGEKNIFTKFNWHSTSIVNCATLPDHPTDPCHFGYTQDNASPYIQSAYSDGNSAYVEVVAQPGSNGSSHAEVGIKFSAINLNGYTIPEAKALPVKVTIKFTYHLTAKSVFGSAGAGLNIMPLAPSWYHLIDNPGGGEFGPNNAVAIYDTNLGAIWGGVWIYLMSIAHTGVKDPLPEISFGYSDVTINEISISSLCDYISNENGEIERCFGGIGPQCAGIPLPFTKNNKTCEVNGWASVGSILHDNCCLQTNNLGYSCIIPYIDFGSKACRKEWREAEANVACYFIGAERIWRQKFGPYLDPNEGDKMSRKAPSGAHVNPEYESLCITGSCLPDPSIKNPKRAKPLLFKDDCGFYCICE